MAMKRCPDCGEKYSDTYKCCPFCEEEAALQEERPFRRKGARRSACRKEPSILTPVLVVVIVVLAVTLGWLFFGDSIKEKLGGGTTPGVSSSEVDPSQSGSSSGDTSLPGIGDSSGDSSSSAGEEPGSVIEPGNGTETDASELTVEQVAALPDTLTLSNTDFTLPVGDPAVKLTVSGGSGSYTWYSEDDGIASVDENGTVTAISAGIINVYATDGTGKGLCIVRVRGGSGSSGSSGNTVTPSGGNVKLNREDFTLGVGESFQLKNTGITTAQTWSSSNPSVATVNGSGMVTGVSAGMATVTMSYDGNSLTCIVRVK
ncbi:Ig-like domain-containing protein [Oscillibacter sp. GMB15532]|uniref:Ig-like domain-containing protein n=1 Tax=Oscillibacter sp. GMB15532 TaxID=3230022 RepID=UPI0034DEF89F